MQNKGKICHSKIEKEAEATKQNPKAWETTGLSDGQGPYNQSKDVKTIFED